MASISATLRGLPLAMVSSGLSKPGKKTGPHSAGEAGAAGMDFEAAEKVPEAASLPKPWAKS